MNNVLIYYPKDSLHRGGGRYLKSLVEVIDRATLIEDFSRIDTNDTLIVPFWKPTERPLINGRICQKQILCLLDVIPLAHPDHFPLGWRGRWNVRNSKKSLSNFDKIVTISLHSKAEIVRVLGVDEKKIEVIYPTLEPIFFDKKIGSISDIDLPFKDYFIYVGDTNWNKNLVNLANSVKKSNSNLVVVGKVFENLKLLSSEKNLDEYVNSLTHIEQKPMREFAQITYGDKRFFFTGFVNDDTLEYLYKNAIANISVSFDEGFGYAYFEAASQGCPSILSDVEIYRETSTGGGAIFANPSDVDQIANCMTNLQNNKSSRDELAQKASKRLYEVLDKNIIRNMWTKLIH